MPYHYKDTFLWASAPSVADLVLRQLGEAVHKQLNSLRVFISPKLMMTVWVRLLFNISQFLVHKPPGEMFQTYSMHESFVLVFIFPLINHRPWCIRGAPKVLGLGRMVSLLIREISGDAGSVLHQLWLLTKRVDSISGVLARGLLLS